MNARITALTLASGMACLAAAHAAMPPSVPKAAPAAAAQPSEVQLPDLGVDQLLQRNAAARGGLANWQRVNSMALSGKLDAGRTRVDGGAAGQSASTFTSKLGHAQTKAQARRNLLATGTLDGGQLIQLPFQLELKRPAMTRLEVPFQGDTAVQVYDGHQGWKLRPYVGRREAEAFNPEELKQASNQQPIDGLLMGHAARGITVVLDGAELVEGQPAYRLKLAFKNGEVRHLWVDAQRFLELKMDGPSRFWNGRMRTVATYFRDYRAEQGLLMAHRLETVMEGVPGSESIYIEAVALNPALDDRRFAKPE